LRKAGSDGKPDAQMASVVFFRAVNVGGHQAFKPAQLAKEIAGFDVVNIGAAGTLVVRGNASPAELRDEILRRLPFQPELMICSAKEVLDLVHSRPFQAAATGKDLGHFVSVLLKAPQVKPKLPLEQPPGAGWEVRIVTVIGRFALSVRRLGQTYSNAVVEKQFGVPATTRNWNTMVAVGEVLEK
jgi:uncharacterized protein (DUF1697 family)